jgi:hypothetical protein
VVVDQGSARAERRWLLSLAACLQLHGGFASAQEAPRADLYVQGDYVPAYFAEILIISSDDKYVALRRDKAAVEDLVEKCGSLREPALLINCAGMWPDKVEMPADLLNASFKGKSARQILASLPDVGITPIVSQSHLSGIPAKDGKPNPQLVARLCSNFQWAAISEIANVRRSPNKPPIELEGSCVLRVYATAEPGQEQQKVNVLVRRLGLKLTFNQARGDAQSDKLLAGIRSDLLSRVNTPSSASLFPSDVFVRAERGASAGYLPQQMTANATVDANWCHRRMKHRRLLRWPNESLLAERPEQGTMAIVYDSQVENVSPSNTTYVPFYASGELYSVWTDHSSQAPNLLISLCREVTASENTRIKHPLAVASVLTGRRQKVDGVEVSGLLNDIVGYFAPTKGFEEIRSGLPGDGSHWVAALSVAMPAPKPLSRKQASDFVNALVDQAMVAVVAAPERLQNEIRSIPRSRLVSPQSVLAGSLLQGCSAWPICLGATPFVIGVAALDREGKSLFRPDDYMLGSAVIHVAAPGEDIPVIASTSGSSPVPAIASGSSFAAPAVAALAAALHDQAGAEANGVSPVISRIVATADLYKTNQRDANNRVLPDLVRFGPVNAARALAGIQTGRALKQAAIWNREEKSEEPRFGKIELPPGAMAGNPCERELSHGSMQKIRFVDVDASGTPSEKGFDVGLGQLRRIIPDVVIGDRQTFTVIYTELSTAAWGKAGHVPVPIIRRAVIFGKNLSTNEWCEPRGHGVKRPACLYFSRVDRSGVEDVWHQFEPLDLTASDVVFPIESKPALLKGNGLWKRYFSEVRKSACM